MEELLKFLAAGGDIGTYVLLFAIYKIDKRLSVVEYKINDR